MKRTLFTVLVVAFCMSDIALANKTYNLTPAKSKQLFASLQSAIGVSGKTKIDLSGIYCFVRYEKQSGDPSVKAEVLAMPNCNFDEVNDVDPLSGSKAETFISALSKVGVKLGKSVKTEGGISERSLFVQSISCSKIIEYGQTKDLNEVVIEVASCSVEI